MGGVLTVGNEYSLELTAPFAVRTASFVLCRTVPTHVSTVAVRENCSAIRYRFRSITRLIEYGSREPFVPNSDCTAG
ncbi:hypothetical protein C495_10779 [Natronorubrum sulfidifaciens JCM 14089]|uniref:Uncharacterized protein n=1 Tax=Natronorubrum sulfidifaciens JCM 14089 TaxID=1230460 RepID=L9W503_9EURY|nr:hypothetical protein C495_10779 [Natronorubrum sulfidifaciens JCM 14089]